MEYLIVPAAALVASLLTLFSGFGLGTLLLPAFALFFPAPLAIAMTAVVHLLNNLFKLSLLARHADWSVVVRFGVAAVVGALLGALLLNAVEGAEPVASYTVWSRGAHVTWLGLLVGTMIVGFGVLELVPLGTRLALSRRHLPWGGLASGFFGGLSGHQGALRSAFLIKLNLSPQAFAATGAVIAVFVDLTRLGVYSTHLRAGGVAENWGLVLAATAAAFVGVLVGSRLLRKVTIKGLQRFVAGALIVFGVAMAVGLV